MFVAPPLEYLFVGERSGRRNHGGLLLIIATGLRRVSQLVCTFEYVFTDILHVCTHFVYICDCAADGAAARWRHAQHTDLRRALDARAGQSNFVARTFVPEDQSRLFDGATDRRAEAK